MALTEMEKAEFRALEYRYLKHQKSPPPPKDENLAAIKNLTEAISHRMDDKPIPATPVAPPTKPKQWKFNHRYDVYNKLVETTAEAV